MKKNFIPILLSFFLFITFFSSCKKGSDEESNYSNLITNEVIKIETNYEEGGIKYEGPFGDLEIETSAPDEYINKVRAELLKSYSKQISYAKNYYYDYKVAVFKDQTCGSYAQLDVNMDCQDSGADSWVGGYHGSTTRSSSYNILFKFCVIPSSLFNPTVNNYAVLNVTSDHIPTFHRIDRYFDNEDSNNNNSQFYNGSSLEDGVFGDCYFGANTILSFYYYEAVDPESAEPFDNIGISYLVLGTFGPEAYRGTIHTDDENLGNANHVIKHWWNGTDWDSTFHNSLYIPGIWNATANTDLWVTRVNY